MPTYCTSPPHQHFGLVHFLPDLAYAAHLPVLHGEVAGAAGDLKQEVPQHVHAPLRQIYFRVKLRPVELLLLVGDTWDGKRDGIWFRFSVLLFAVNEGVKR